MAASQKVCPATLARFWKKSDVQPPLTRRRTNTHPLVEKLTMGSTNYRGGITSTYQQIRLESTNQEEDVIGFNSL